jgi:anti-sigma factor RsiW
MNCQQAQDLLLDLAYDELDAATGQAVQAHADTCPACREELAKLRRARAAPCKG